MNADKNEISKLIVKQLSNSFLVSDEEIAMVGDAIPVSLERLEKSFSHISNKYYCLDNETFFNPLHSCQYAQFLYYLSNSLFLVYGGANRALCDKIYCLNKMLSSCDMYYEVQLPDIFFFDHPLGSVIGRANYSNYFSFSQGVTVGNNNGIYPSFGERVFLLSNSKVIGNSHIGKNVIISANSYVKDTDIPDNSIVFGQSPNLIIKENREETVLEFSKSIFRG